MNLCQSRVILWLQFLIFFPSLSFSQDLIPTSVALSDNAYSILLNPADLGVKQKISQATLRTYLQSFVVLEFSKGGHFSCRLDPEVSPGSEKKLDPGLFDALRCIIAEENPAYEYALTEAVTSIWMEQLKPLNDREKQRQLIGEAVLEHPEVGPLLLQIAGSRLHDFGYNCSDCPRLGTSRELNWEKFVKVALRFIYVDQIQPNGKVQLHVCSGINAISELEDLDSELIRLAYEVIWRNVILENPPLIELIGFTVERQKKLFTEPDLDLRLGRLQGAIWADLGQNEDFQSMLKEGVCSILGNYTYQWTGCKESEG
ncbi:hypothetical protein IIA15_06875 [candidate division TA06 bacterium]|nr:hypothetical protein [candidate division TA06 bacterium]